MPRSPLSVLLPATALLGPLAGGAPAGRPNVVYMLADDLGYGDVGCYNPASRIPTPCLDALARQGRRFTDAHAPDTVCTPSRYAILTGRYSFRTRLKRGVLEPFGAPLIVPGQLTWPEMMRSAGYVTAAFGKWHLGWDWRTRDGRRPEIDGANVIFDRPIGGGPTTVGFDRYFGVDIPNFPPYGFIDGDRMPVLPTVPAPMQRGRLHRPGPMVPGWSLEAVLPEITRRAIGFIDENAHRPDRRPFFLYLAFTAPHYPIVPTREFRGRSRAGAYGDYVVELDAMVGRVLAELDRAGVAGRTLVCFSSDNGPEVIEVEPGAYERLRLYGHSSMGDLRGAKRDAWEGGHRVPFIARWPGHVPAGTTDGELVSEMDMMRTCAEILGLRLPDGAAEDSFSILPALTGRPHERPPRPFFVIHTGDNHYGVRSGRWVFIDAPTGSGNAPRGREPEWFKRERGYVDDHEPGLLYDVGLDLPERTNEYARHPEVVAELKALLRPYEKAGRAAAPAPAGRLAFLDDD